MLELKRQGLDAYSVLGNWRGHPHQWVVVGAYGIDPTRDQFRHYVSDLEEVEFLDKPVFIWRGQHADYGSTW